jgi:hypothetical protein
MTTPDRQPPTTDEMLAECEKLIQRWEQTGPFTREENEAAEAFTRVASELFFALRRGAELPAEWRQRPATRATIHAYTGQHEASYHGKHEVQEQEPRRLTDAELVGAVLQASNRSIAQHVLDRFAELGEEIRELQARLDNSDSTGLVLHCLRRDAEMAMSTSTHEDPGTILRATDTGDAWTLGEDKRWTPRG